MAPSKIPQTPKSGNYMSEKTSSQTKAVPPSTIPKQKVDGRLEEDKLGSIRWQTGAPSHAFSFGDENLSEAYKILDLDPATPDEQAANYLNGAFGLRVSSRFSLSLALRLFFLLLR
jgi:hypothetical protein